MPAQNAIANSVLMISKVLYLCGSFSIVINYLFNCLRQPFYGVAAGYWMTARLPFL
jgi:hypothetical protein